jgi:hypothetical protein
MQAQPPLFGPGAPQFAPRDPERSIQCPPRPATTRSVICARGSSPAKYRSTSSTMSPKYLLTDVLCDDDVAA